MNLWTLFKGNKTISLERWIDSFGNPDFGPSIIYDFENNKLMGNFRFLQYQDKVDTINLMQKFKAAIDKNPNFGANGHQYELAAIAYCTMLVPTGYALDTIGFYVPDQKLVTPTKLEKHSSEYMFGQTIRKYMYGMDSRIQETPLHPAIKKYDRVNHTNIRQIQPLSPASVIQLLARDTTTGRLVRPSDKWLIDQMDHGMSDSKLRSVLKCGKILPTYQMQLIKTAIR